MLQASIIVICILELAVRTDYMYRKLTNSVHVKEHNRFSNEGRMLPSLLFPKLDIYTRIIHLLLLILRRFSANTTLKSVQLRFWLQFPKQNPAPEPPRELTFQLKTGMCACGHTKNIVQLFQRALLSFGQEEEEKKESDDVEAGVEAEGAGRGEGQEETREGNCENAAPEVCTKADT